MERVVLTLIRLINLPTQEGGRRGRRGVIIGEISILFPFMSILFVQQITFSTLLKLTLQNHKTNRSALPNSLYIDLFFDSLYCIIDQSSAYSSLSYDIIIKAKAIY